ncbi:Broad-complex core protein isoform 6 [Portunus trituberculatus]|uniref:Broad-complex core protein isoform 6 n=1 Tax=Portunus trituberculatus TaxID=210409 RepID=A0A5B7G2A4_PORTR|nr:Broad-complex core protein isoform 6 [Portunus trituberculatus]
MLHDTTTIATREVMATNSNASQSSIHSFSWNHHRQTFFNTIFNLRKEEVFCDVTLACDGILFPTHRLVLAMCSEFFNEILTKVPSQQPMLVLVPTVSAEDLEALLTYIYRGEMQVPRANLPSIMKAAKTLKIKGFCNTNVEETLLDQNAPGEETNIMESDEENNCHENIYSVSPDSPGEIAQEHRLLPKLKELRPSGLRYPQV